MKGRTTWNHDKGIQEILTKGVLSHLYFNEHLSMKDISDRYNCAYGTIYYLMSKFGIKRRSRSQSRLIKNPGGFKKGYTPWNKGIRYNNPKGKEYWANPINREKQLKKIFEGFHKRPTYAEKLIIRICKKNRFPFRYCGDGSSIIGGKIPDFLYEEGKKIIEVFGRAFHDPNEAIFPVTWDRQYFGRMAYYSQLNYDCLILWDDELEEEVVVEKIRSFLNG